MLLGAEGADDRAYPAGKAFVRKPRRGIGASVLLACVSASFFAATDRVPEPELNCTRFSGRVHDSLKREADQALLRTQGWQRPGVQSELPGVACPLVSPLPLVVARCSLPSCTTTTYAGGGSSSAGGSGGNGGAPATGDSSISCSAPGCRWATLKGHTSMLHHWRRNHLSEHGPVVPPPIGGAINTPYLKP